ncbi:MAG: carbon storage regulator [Planctomycetaceae bacterium]
MLVLSRKVGETICIGEDITITVVRVEGNRVKVGIEAAAHHRIMRAELVQHDRDPLRTDLRTEGARPVPAAASS